MKILIIRFSSIGDIVLTTPVVRCVKQQLNATVHFLTKKTFENIVTHNPFIDKVFTIQKKVSEVLPLLKAENYDWVIDLHKNWRSWHVRRSLESRATTFDKLNIEKWLYVQFKINRLPPIHLVDRYLNSLAQYGVKADTGGLNYFIPVSEEVDIQKQFGLVPEEYVAFVTGAAHATKRLPETKIIEVCQQLSQAGQRVILLGGKDEREKGAKIASIVGENCKNACGGLNLHQSASVVRQAGVVIAHDTGLMHIAAAFQKKIVVLWGSTVPAFGMYPYRTEYTSLEINHLHCRPCTKIGIEKCPKGHFRCMNDLESSKIVDSALYYLKGWLK